MEGPADASPAAEQARSDTAASPSAVSGDAAGTEDGVAVPAARAGQSSQQQPQHYRGLPPPQWRRLLAVASLAATGLIALFSLVFVLNRPVLLLLVVGGLGLSGAGGWWLVTERAERRRTGIILLSIGVVLLIVCLIATVATVTSALWRLILVFGLTAVAVAGARGALVPDLHELDRIRSHRVRPSRPVLICNPRSGNGKVTRLGLAERASGLGVEVVMLEPGDDLEHLARAAIARGADCLGMAGGDGSQSLVASIAVEHDLPFVCISAGTRNHFALDLGLAKDDPAAGLDALVDGVERRVDHGSVNGRLFVNNVSLGVYATIVQDSAYRDAKLETTRQKLPTLVGPEAQPFDLQFTTPEGREIDGAFLVMVSNNQYFLSPGLDIAQRRSLDSGRLGVIAITGASAAEAGRLVGLTAIGGGARDPNLHLFSGETFEVRSHSGSAAAGIDGEAVDLPTPMRFEIHPRALRVLVPPESVQTAEVRRTRGLQLRALVDVARGRPARLDG